MPYKNKNKKREYQKEYQRKNRDKLSLYQKVYKKKNKEILARKFIEFKSKNQQSFICKNCKKQCKRRIYDSRDKIKFCSSVCALNKVRTKRHQIEAGKRAGMVIIAKYRGTGKSYIREKTQHQHRVVMEKILGRKLKKGEVVHHKDMNKQNNNPNNLQVMTQSEHARLHILTAKRNKLGYLLKTK